MQSEEEERTYNELLTEFLSSYDIWQHQILSFVGEVPGTRGKTMTQNYFSIMLTCSHLYQSVLHSDLFLFLKFVYCGSHFEKLPALLPSPELTMRSTMIEKGSKVCRLENIHFKYVDRCATDDYKDRFFGMMKYVTWKFPDFMAYKYGGHPGLTQLQNDLLEIVDVVKKKELELESLRKVQPLILKNIDYLKLGRMFELTTFVDCFGRFLSSTKLSDEELLSWKPVLYAIFEFDESSSYMYYTRNFDWVDQLQAAYPEEVKKLVIAHPRALKYVADLQKDRLVVMRAVFKDWECFKYVSEELASDADVIRLAIKRSNFSIDLGRSSLISNREFMLEAIVHLQHSASLRESVLWSDPSFVKQALTINPSLTISCVMQSRYTVELDDGDSDDESGNVSTWEDPRIAFVNSIDRSVLLRALRQDGSILQFIPEQVQDEELALAAIESPSIHLHIVPRISEMPSIINACFQHNKMPPHLKVLQHSRDVVLQIMKHDGFSWRSIAYKDDREIALAAASSYGRVLEKFPNNWKQDREIVTTALQNNGEAITFVPPPLCEELEIVLTAVRSTGTALRFLPARFRDDREIVLAACNQSVAAYKYASPRLQDDPEVISAAVVFQD